MGHLTYQSMWLAQFRYSALVIGFKTVQLEKEQRSIIVPCLSASGFCNKMHRAVVYGPVGLGGMDWDNCGIFCLFEKPNLLIGSI